jgi:hypothetical protein
VFLSAERKMTLNVPGSVTLRQAAAFPRAIFIVCPEKKFIVCPEKKTCRTSGRPALGAASALTPKVRDKFPRWINFNRSTFRVVWHASISCLAVVLIVTPASSRHTTEVPDRQAAISVDQIC